MRITHIRAHNLRQLADVDVAVPRTLALVVGPNDSGKTTLLCIATRWALWGAHAVPSQGRQVRSGEQDMEVTVTFEVNGWEYVVQRRLHLANNGRTTAALDFEVVDGDHMTAATIVETQALINELIGTYETFRMTAYVDQVEGPGDFLRRKPADQREVLREILALGDWDAWYVKARDKASDMLTDITVAESRLAGMREDVQEIPGARSALTKVSATATAALIAVRAAQTLATYSQARAEELFQQHEAHVGTLSSLKSLDGRVEQLGERVKRAERVVSIDDDNVRDADVIKGAYDRWVVAGQEYDDQVESIRVHNTKIAQLNDEAREDYGVRAKAVADEVSRIQKEHSDRAAARKAAAKCPECGQPIDVPDALEPVAPQPATLPVIQSYIQAPVGVHRPEEVISAFNNLRITQATALEHQETLSQARKDLDGANSYLSELYKDMPADTDAEEAEQARKVNLAAEATLKHEDVTYQQAIREEGRFEQALAQLVETEGKAGVLADGLMQQREAQRIAELTAEVFSPGGARQLALDQAVGELEVTSNEALATLMPGYSIHFSTQSATGVETLEQGIRTPVSEKLLSWEDLGGAASVAVALAVRVGLIELLAKYRGVRYEHMILDEADSWLVGEKQDAYVRLLARLSETMSVTAISHIPTVQETIGEQIVLVPGPNGTTIGDLR